MSTSPYGDVAHREFTTRSLTRPEVLEKAASLGWPEVIYRSYRVVTLTGERAWREAGLADPAARRDVYRQLLALEHRNEGENRNG